MGPHAPREEWCARNNSAPAYAVPQDEEMLLMNKILGERDPTSLGL
jgi:hypothetical protein